MPDNIAIDNLNTTKDVHHEKEILAEMWWELARKPCLRTFSMFVRQYVEHMGLSKAFEAMLQKHKRGYTTPKIPYLLEAALFDGQRILPDRNYESIEEQVMFAVLEYIRQKKTAKNEITLFCFMYYYNFERYHIIHYLF